MITIVLTYRNRKLGIVKRCFDSLEKQFSKEFNVILVNYGSSDEYTENLNELAKKYDFISVITVKVQKQLWNKSKAINIALNKCETSYFFVGDIDMIYNPNFVNILNELMDLNSIWFFQVGFLDKNESVKTKGFKSYSIKHLSSKEATGMTLFPTEVLKQINGYDEFYHGWGAEDSDVHRRLEHAGFTVNFYDKEILMLHQWHEKNYRTDISDEPFHSDLEKINHQYYAQTIESKKVKANVRFEWGKMIEKDYFDGVQCFTLSNERNETDAFLNGEFLDSQCSFSVFFSSHPEDGILKNSLKKLLGKKYKQFYSFNDLNDMILMHVIAQYRNSYYEYEWDKINETINLKISL